VVIAPVLTVHPNLPRQGGQPLVVGEQGAALTVAAQGLGREEAAAADAAEAAGTPLVMGGAEALGAVFDHRQAVSLGDGVDGGHVSALAVEADRHDGLDVGADSLFQQGGVEVEGARIDVHIDRSCPHQGDYLAGGDEGEGGGNDLVSRPDVQGHQGDHDGVGAAADAHAVAGAHIVGQPLLQLLYLRPQYIAAVVQHSGDAPVDALSDACLLGLEVDEFHGAGLFRCLCVLWLCRLILFLGTHP